MTEQNAPPVDAELVEVAARIFAEAYWRGNLPNYSRSRSAIQTAMSAVIAKTREG